MTAIVKLLCHTIKETTREKSLSDEAIIKTTDDVNAKIQDDKRHLPVYLIEGFDVLKNNVNKTNRSELISYFDSLRNVCVDFPTENV